MKYYKVKSEYDGVTTGTGRVLVAGELYSNAEFSRFRVPQEALTRVDISKNLIYKENGRRFEREDGNTDGVCEN